MLVQGHDTSAIQNAVHDLLSDARKEAIAADPYAAPAVVLERLLPDFDQSTWSCRGAIKNLEKQP